MVVTGALLISDAAVATGVSTHTPRYDERPGLTGAQLDAAARNVAAVVTTIEMDKERITR